MNNLYSTVGLLYGGPQAIAGYARGDKEQLAAGLEKIKSWTDSANEQFPAAVSLENFLDDPSFENGKLYLGSAVGSIASTLPTLFTGAAGAGAAIGMGVARKAGERALAKGLTAAAAQAAENNVIKYAVLAAAAPTAALMNTGETVAGLAEADPNDTHPELALGVGALKTGLDFVGMGGVLNAFLKTGSRGVIENALVGKFGPRMGNALVGAFGAAGKEGVTEGLQELADVVAQESLRPGDNPDVHKLAIKIADSAIKGAVGGGLGGGIGGLFKPAEAAPAPPAQVAAEVKADQGIAEDKPTLPGGPPNVDMAGSPGYSPNFTELNVVNSLNEQLAKQYGFAPEAVALDAEQNDELRTMLGLPTLAERPVAPEGPQRRPLDPLVPGMEGPDTSPEAVADILAGRAAEIPGAREDIKLYDASNNDIVPELKTLVAKLLGPQHAFRVNFVDRMFHPKGHEVRGLQWNDKAFGPMAAVALQWGNGQWSTTHEATHVAQDLGLIPEGAAELVNANLPRVEKLIAQAHKEGFDAMGATLESGSWQKPDEAIAYANEAYAFLRSKGLSPGYAGPLRSVFEPIFQFFQRLGNFLRLKGFNSLNDVLDSFTSGKFAEGSTPVRRAAAVYGAPQAAILAWHGKKPIEGEVLDAPTHKQETIPEQKPTLDNQGNVVSPQRELAKIEGGKVTPLIPNLVDVRAAEAAMTEALDAVPSLKVEDPGKQMMWHEQWLNHTSAIANKFPAARRFANALRTMNLERQRYMAEGRSLLQPFHDLKADASMRVNKMVVESDLHNRFATPEGNALVLKDTSGNVLASLSDPKEIEAYNAYRKVGELYKNGLKQSLLRALDQPLDTTASGLRQEASTLADGEQKLLLTHLADSLDEIAARNFYMPHMREGTHSIAVKDATGETLYFEKFNLPRFGRDKFLKELGARLRAAYPNGKIQNVKRDVRAEMGSSLLGNVGLVEGLASVFDAADSKTAEQMFNRLKTEMAQRSFKQHLRKRKNIPGYITPVNEKDYALIAMERYIPSVSNFLAKQGSQSELNEGMREVAEADDPRLLKWATKLKDYTASTHEEAGWLRGLAFHAFLGGNLSSALINITQVPLAGMPFMGQFGKDTLAYFPKASLDASRATNLTDILRNRAIAPAERLTYLPANERAMLQTLQDEGTVSPVQLKNTEAHIEDTIRRWNAPKVVVQPLLRLLAVSGAPFAVTEQANRITMALAAFRWATATPDFVQRVTPQWEANRMAGTPLTPTSFARYVVENTQFMMDKANRPAFTQGTLPSVATQFMSYPIQMIELMGNLWAGSGLGAKGKFALAGMLFGLWTLGGLWAQPGADLARRLTELLAKLTGRTINMDMMARQWLNELGLSKATAEAVMKGPWRLTGMDISGRVDINPIKIGNLTGATATAATGPAGGAIFGILGNVIADWNKDKPFKAVVDANPIMQTAVKNAVEGYAAQKEGFLDQKGRTIVGPEHVTKPMALLKVMGFTPTEVAQARERKQFDQAILESQKGRTETYARRVADAQVAMVRARAAGDAAKAQEALTKLAKVQQEMVEGNKGKKLADTINIKGVFESAKKQVAEDLTGGYNSMLKVKGKALLKKPELLESRQP